jgi:hypothetical protein
MLKHRAIDKYIKRATAGLPHLERIDTAAEIRVNLNVRIKELMLEGHPRDEAEFLAIKGMGDAFTTNRALLGHAFTHRIGWVLVAATLLVGAGLWIWQHRWDYFWVDTTIQKVELNTRDISHTILQDENFISRGAYKKYELNLPRFTKCIEVLLVQENRSRWVVGVSRDPRTDTKYDSVVIPEKVNFFIATGILKKLNPRSEIHSLDTWFEETTESVDTSAKSSFRFSDWVATGDDWADVSGKDSTQIGGHSYLTGIDITTEKLKLEQWNLASISKIMKYGDNTGKSHLKIAVLIRPTAKSKPKLSPIEAKFNGHYIVDSNGNELSFGY